MSNLHNNPHLELPPAPTVRQQQHVASVYPQLPSQDELPSYSPYPSPQYTPQQQYNKPQQNSQQQYSQPQYNQQQSSQQQYNQHQYNQQQYNQQQYNQQLYHQEHYQQQQQQQQPFSHPPVQPAYYGSMAAPNISMPTPIQPQNSPQATNILAINELKTKSELVECPHCHQLVYTVLDYDAGLCTGLSIAGLFLAGCNNGLCLLPWLFPWTKDVTHQCPSCKENIATFTRLERNTRVLSP